MPNVQFRGIDKVCDAYDNMSIDAFAIYCKRELMFKGIGKDELEEFLKLLQESSGNIVYTLRVFETVTEKSQINSKTASDGGFYFCLGEAYEGNALYERSDRKNKLVQRVEELEERISGTGNEDESFSIGAIIRDAVSDPVKLGQYVSVFREVMAGLFTPQQPVYNPLPATRIGHTMQQEQPATTTAHENDPAKMQRLASALDILGENDPDLVDHLEKLAIMSQDKPAQFKMLIGMLKTF